MEGQTIQWSNGKKDKRTNTTQKTKVAYLLTVVIVMEAQGIQWSNEKKTKVQILHRKPK